MIIVNIPSCIFYQAFKPNLASSHLPRQVIFQRWLPPPKAKCVQMWTKDAYDDTGQDVVVHVVGGHDDAVAALRHL